MSEIMAGEEQICQQLQAEMPQAVVRADEPLAKRTTLRVGGNADIYVEPSSENDLVRLVNFCRERDLPFLVLGRGSNLLIRDGGIRGVVISLVHPAFCGVEAFGRQICCGGGAKLKAVAARAREAQLAGLEFLEGIPGSVGGALRMNAGAMGGATFGVVTHVRFMDQAGEIYEFSASRMNAGYRSCPLLKGCVALGATFQGEPSSRELIDQRSREFNQRRWQSQPKEPSAGCIFQNPSSTISAGQTIDEVGLKGARVGGAVVSSVHANFIVNEGGAIASDVLELIDMIRTRVQAERGIELETEVQIIGEDLAATPA
jgi:UDP-N-acetylenolpyruvoylglucosamine reductase